MRLWEYSGFRFRVWGFCFRGSSLRGDQPEALGVVRFQVADLGFQVQGRKFQV